MNIVHSPYYFLETATWSLLSYLEYREHTEDFTRDKSLEHQFYVKDLEYLQKNPEEYPQAEQAKQCLLNFQLIECALVDECRVRVLRYALVSIDAIE
ncbi:3503_t:CDS:2 [Funneliformis caledonium]|uniref:3503_t:CDS:1 n=1 Tax=Funneliformis caledonium TaxID=1117310 RepID=A0A9N9DV91_9GLOM|nr:3503_t:CDS:2 [Funneliformis caledonium]